MRCPHCFSLCMPDDTTCSTCRRSLGRGVSRVQVSTFVVMTFGVLATVILVACVHPTTKWDDTSLLADMICITLAILVGQVIGWVVGLLFCRR